MHIDIVDVIQDPRRTMMPKLDEQSSEEKNLANEKKKNTTKNFSIYFFYVVVEKIKRLKRLY